MVMPVDASGWAARGYPCRTATCRGHIRGWEFGEAYGIEDVDYANGNSESFNEGVRAYAEERAEELAGVLGLTAAGELAPEVSGGGMVSVAGHMRGGVFVSPYQRRLPTRTPQG